MKSIIVICSFFLLIFSGAGVIEPKESSNADKSVMLVEENPLVITNIEAISHTNFQNLNDGNVGDQKKIQVVFVLDVTGSMSGLIATAKEKIWSIANNFASAKPTPEIYMGIVAYRDRGDDFVTQVIELTTDLDMVYEKLMLFQAQGGGDTPESVNAALYDAINTIKWDLDKNTYRTVFLVGDAPPQMTYRDDVKYELTCGVAKQKDIPINTIRLGSITEAKPHWVKIAEMTKGEYFELDAAGSDVAVKTPYDGDIAKLSAELDNTRIYYGSVAMQTVQEERVVRSKDINAEASESAVARRASYNLSGSGKDKFFGDNELINDMEKGTVKLQDLKEDEMPLAMQKMNEKEQEEYVNQMLTKRKDLEKQLTELNQKRNEYIKNQLRTTAQDNTFTGQVMKAVKTQSKDNFEFGTEILH